MKVTTQGLPKALTDRLSDIAGSAGYAGILQAFAARRKTCLRVNRLKSSPVQIAALLKKHDIQYQTVSWSTDAFVLPHATAKSLSELPEYAAGEFYVQNLSSMLPARILDPQPGERVLDATAAPGSKTTQMAAQMANSGEIVANDISAVRREKLKANVRIQGVSNVSITGIPAQGIWQTYPEYFDKTLVDVPCSMEGRIQLHLPKTYTSWSLHKVKELSRKQRWILRSAVSATAVGGMIVYSTCTLSPEENEDVIDWILQKEKGAVTTEPIRIDGLPAAPALSSFAGKKFDPGVLRSLRVLPTGTYEGFFVTKLRKIRSNLPGSRY